MRQAFTSVLASLLLVGLSACIQETAAVDPWVTDGQPTVDTLQETADTPDEVAPPTGWTAVQVELDPGEAIVDWIGATVNDVRTLFFLSDWGRLGRIRPGEPAETLHGFASETEQAFRGLWTADGKTFWIVGIGNTVWKGKTSLWSKGEPPDDKAGNWTGVWGNGDSVIWFSGESGYFLRLDGDGKNPQRFQQGSGNVWRSPTGDHDYAWLLSDTHILRLTNGEFTDKPTKGALALSAIATGQTGERLRAIDATHLYLVGKPTQLIRGSGEHAIAFQNPPIFSGINAFYDVHGLSNGARLACGVKGGLHQLDASDAEMPLDTDGLPQAEDLRRVWLFDDGSAYTLSATSGVYYRAAQ